MGERLPQTVLAGVVGLLFSISASFADSQESNESLNSNTISDGDSDHTDVGVAVSRLPLVRTARQSSSQPLQVTTLQASHHANTRYVAQVSIKNKRQLDNARSAGLPEPTLGQKQYTFDHDVYEELLSMNMEMHVLRGTTTFSVEPGLSRNIRNDSEYAEGDVVAGRQSNATDSFTISSGTVNDSITDAGWIWRWVRDSGGAPVGAETTQLEYRLRIHNDSDSSNFWAGDYEIYLSSEESGGGIPYHLVYDNLGGSTDGGYDDDSADDSDIYLNWRSTSQFNGQDPNQKWYVYIKDTLSGDVGFLQYIEFTIHWETIEQHPDLRAPSYQVKSDTVVENDPFWVRFRIRNDGNADAGSSVARLYLSTDNDFDVSDDTNLGDIGVGALGAGEEEWVQWDFAMPSIGDDSSEYDVWVIAVVDVHGYVQESNESNVFKSNDVAYIMTPLSLLPDLQAPSYRLSASTVQEGSSFWVEQRIHNAGSTTAPASHARAYLSTDGDFDTSDDYDLGQLSVDSLASSGEQWIRWNFNMPNLGADTYDVWTVVEVDSQDEVQESNENNVYKSNDAAFTASDPLIEEPEIRVSPGFLNFQR